MYRRHYQGARSFVELAIENNLTRVIKRVRQHFMVPLLMATRDKEHYLGTLFANGGIGDFKLFGIIREFII